MQFINIVVHSVEDMNFRVHLQYEFTKLGLDEYLDVSSSWVSAPGSVGLRSAWGWALRGAGAGTTRGRGGSTPCSSTPPLPSQALNLLPADRGAGWWVQSLPRPRSRRGGKQ